MQRDILRPLSCVAYPFRQPLESVTVERRLFHQAHVEFETNRNRNSTSIKTLQVIMVGRAAMKRRREERGTGIELEQLQQCLDSINIVGIIITQQRGEELEIVYLNESAASYVSGTQDRPIIESHLAKTLADSIQLCHTSMSSTSCIFRSETERGSYLVDVHSDVSPNELVTTTLVGHFYDSPLFKERLLPVWEQQMLMDVVESYEMSLCLMDLDEDKQDVQIRYGSPAWTKTFFPVTGKWARAELNMSGGLFNSWIVAYIENKMKEGVVVIEKPIDIANGEVIWTKSKIKNIGSKTNDQVFGKMDSDKKVHRMLCVATVTTQKKKAERMVMLQSQLMDTSDFVMIVVEPLPDGHLRYHSFNKRVRENHIAMGTPISTETPTTKELGLRVDQVKLYTDLISKARAAGKLYRETLHDHVLDHWYISSACEISENIFAIVNFNVAEVMEIAKNLQVQIQAKEAALRAQERFLAVMSHGEYVRSTYVLTDDRGDGAAIRTPLGGIIEALNHFSESPLSDADHDIVNLGKGCCEQLLSVINDILDYSKVESGQLSLEYQPALLQGAIEESVDIITMQANKKCLPIITDALFPIGTQILMDRGRFRQIIVNLLSNAIKFTERGEIVLRCRLSEDSLEVSVSDTGIGISDEFKNQIFNPFAQGDSTITRRFGGSGLGLSICKRFCEKMGGNISFQSVPNQGTTFTFYLPAHACPPEEESRQLSSMEQQLHEFCTTQPRIVSVIESNDRQREVLRTTMENLGLTVETYRDPEAAKKCRHCSVIVLDSQRSDHLESLLSTFPTATVFLSQHFTPGMDAREGGVGEQISRPFRRRQILKTLHRTFFRKNSLSKTSTDMKITPVDLTGLKVMVAEDNPTNQKVIERMLQRIGVKDVYFVDNGKKAVDACEREDYHLILGGAEATKEIRLGQKGKTQTNNLTIVALTADVMSATRQLCLDVGMDQVLTKPVKVESLRKVVLDVYNQIINELCE
ncbi:multi-sensor hybrid histidine kinase [Planoprotostelium fungivorum]|uniref:Multi-sensor hybrid histidine kinase n=1 Tax=Planoprotostelium fungivorum TaxID=1890364 RepID=A0A2P6NBV2_9EUKA|nr:multi-sensor hybrid histidine kinase [Planoprotostelium fungivorum]